jgi:Ca-activated chloride channel family protein
MSGATKFLGHELAHPFLLLLALVPVALVAVAWWRRGRPALRLPDVSAWAHVSGWRARTLRLPLVLKGAALVLLAIALARPRGGEVQESVSTEGIDIVVALDLSVSMLSEDMGALPGQRKNRLDAAKEVIQSFIDRRRADRIGYVTFDEASVPRCPPTMDHDVLSDFVRRSEVDPESSGTALGSGLASAVNRLKDSKAKSRVVILVTDGRNNSGFISPDDAAEIARLMGVKVYAIGVGTRGEAPLPVRGPFGRVEYRMVRADVDETGLQRIADATSGRYYRATHGGELEQIFEDIDKLEKTEIEVERHVRWREAYPSFARAAALVLASALLLGATVWRTSP